MITIKNREKLITNGETELNQKARKLSLDSLESALNAVDPKRIIKSRISLQNSVLKVNGYSFDLKGFKHVYVVGGGKASGSMAEALEQILSEHITDGFINIPRGTKHKTKVIKLHEASHPIPDETGVEGTRRILEIAEKAGENDLVICLISGGGSSLMPLPRGDISIVDKKHCEKTHIGF